MIWLTLLLFVSPSFLAQNIDLGDMSPPGVFRRLLSRAGCCNILENIVKNICIGKRCSIVYTGTACGAPCGPYKCGVLAPDTCTGSNPAPATPAPTVAPSSTLAPTPTTTGEGTIPDATYCAMDRDHTMCKFKGPSSSCASSTIYRGLDEQGKSNILERHNKLRQKVANGEETNGAQPSASNMRKMTWNDELAAIAQRWTDQCTFGHDSSRNTASGTYVGQNAYYSGSSRQATQAQVMAGTGGAVDKWYVEVADPGFSRANINPFKFSEGAGHYTQVVWAESDQVGCGQVYYKNGGWYRSLIVCNYATGGNMRGASMYREGDACSTCDAGFSCDQQFPGLCSA